ncbi:hypothetical protein SNEBB_004590 [Seison nebaliae]|nr:hypothetical protein SNEBB_004590 [Seison nebaliae]
MKYCWKILIGGVTAIATTTSVVHAKSQSTTTYGSVPYAHFMHGDSMIMKYDKSSMKYKMQKYILQLQREICNKMEEYEDEKFFVVDEWQRQIDEGGGGVTCVIEDGQTWERGGVNVSVIQGILPKEAVRQIKSRRSDILDEPSKFFATGISSVIHPRNPYVPTLHFNYRYFELEQSDGKKHWWFGGGTDMTPYFLNEKDCIHFHKVLKKTCGYADDRYYEKFKKWCDTYFFNKHRNEHRGIGGIFFDDLNENDDSEKCFRFVKMCGDSIKESYFPIVDRHRFDGYGLKERDWQLFRRGKYVEFNLIHDRGTKFGLHTPNAQIESILVSMPAVAKWTYKHKLRFDEKKIQEVLNNPRDWIPFEELS